MWRRLGLLGAVMAAGFAAWTGEANAQRNTANVEIRMPADQSSVPRCVTPSRLMRHLLERTPKLDPSFRDIARFYKQHGEALRVRWDYAFFQMLLETNYLSYKQGNGRWGDVNPRQNNFAGIGTTGGGVPGDSFPDVSTGVLGQMQHLVAYSGERVANPVARRTADMQDEIIAKSRALNRPVRFADLTRRWAVDYRYGTSIEWVAERYRQAFCTKTGEPLHPSDDPSENVPPAVEASAPPAAPAGAPSAAIAVASNTPSCGIWSASYGGRIALLIRSFSGATTNYTVLQVDAGQEEPQAQALIRAHARDGETLERFPSRDAAFAPAFDRIRASRRAAGVGRRLPPPRRRHGPPPLAP
jgi:hypothetical protein